MHDAAAVSVLCIIHVIVNIIIHILCTYYYVHVFDLCVKYACIHLRLYRRRAEDPVYAQDMLRTPH